MDKRKSHSCTSRECIQNLEIEYSSVYPLTYPLSVYSHSLYTFYTSIILFGVFLFSLSHSLLFVISLLSSLIFILLQSIFFFFFLNDPAPPEISPLSLHDALPI